MGRKDEIGVIHISSDVCAIQSSGISKRYKTLDLIRGITLISMILYHMVWDLCNIFGVEISWYGTQISFLWQQSICWTFILLSGFCWSMGRKKLKRGLVVLAASLAVTAVTGIFVPEGFILFGVLSLIGTGMLVMIPLDKFYRKIDPRAGLILFFGLFIITRFIASGSIGVGDWVLFTVPEELYANLFTAYLGFPGDGFHSADYFPLIPWLFLYHTGYFLYLIFEKYDFLEKMPEVSLKPVEWPGRHSLMIYLLHQPAVYGVLTAVFAFIK